MAKNKIQIDIEVNGKMQKATVQAQNLNEALNKTAKGAQTADRRLKGAAQASSNSTKNFSKMAQGMNSGIVPAYATLAAQVFAVSAAFQFLQNAFDFNNLIKGQESLGAITGTTYKTISNALVEATEGQLKYADAAKAAAIGTAAGLTSGQLTDLSTAAKNVSLALGRDLTDSFNRLIRGVTKAEPELLDELGIILRLDTANRNYADAINKPVTALTAFEKSQAVTNEVLTQAEEKFSKIQELMDPDAFALNQFIKSFDELLNSVRSFTAEALTPLFKFLSKNTASLTAALALFAVPILKAIIPNLQEWQKSATTAADAQLSAFNKQKEGLKSVTTVTKAEFEKQKSVAKLQKKLADLSFSPKTAGAKLQAGESISLRQATGLRTSLEKGTGGFTGIDEKVKANIKKDLDIIVNNSKRSTDTIKRQWQTAGGVMKASFAGLKVAGSGALLGLSKIGVGAARGIDLAFKAISIIGLLILFKDLAVSVYQFFFPLSEEAKKAQEDADKLLNKYKDLKEELSRSISTRSSGILSLREEVESFSASLQGVDILNFAQDINRLDRNNKPAVESLKEIANEVVRLDSRFKPLADALKNNTNLTKNQIAEMTNLSNSYISAGAASNSLSDLQQDLSRNLDALGKTNLATPFDETIDTLVKMDEAAKTTFAAIEDRIKAQLGGIEELSDAIREQYRNYDASGFLEAEKATAEAAANLKLFRDYSEQYLSIQDRQRANQLKILNMTTLGILFDERRSNIKVSEIAAENKLLGAKANQLSAEAALAALKARGLPADDIRVRAAERNLQIAQDNVEITKAQNAVEQYRLEQQKYLIQSEKRMLALKKQQFNTTKATNALELRMAANRLGLASFGFQQAGDQRNLDTEKLLQDRIAAQEAVRQAEEKLSRSTYSSESARQADVEAFQAAKQRVSLLNLEIAARNSIATIKLNELKAENEVTAAKIEAISFNPVQQAFNERMIELRKEGLDLGLVDQENLLSEVTTQKELMLLLENKQQLFTYITDGISSGLTSIIDGTKSVKQAFADMAVNVLRDIAQMIVKMMVFRALTTFFAATPTLPTNFGSLDAVSGNGMQFAGMARMGGVFSQGQKVSGYATGGIARGANAGYPALLHGTEAVVPLPDGKSIPVSMQGASQQNNVTVNVSVDSQGNGSTNMQQDSAQAGNLGSVIARAVQQELQNQKRSGGILNPYGAA